MALAAGAPRRWAGRLTLSRAIVSYAGSGVPPLPAFCAQRCCALHQWVFFPTAFRFCLAGSGMADNRELARGCCCSHPHQSIATPERLSWASQTKQTAAFAIELAVPSTDKTEDLPRCHHTMIRAPPASRVGQSTVAVRFNKPRGPPRALARPFGRCFQTTRAARSSARVRRQPFRPHCSLCCSGVPQPPPPRLPSNRALRHPSGQDIMPCNSRNRPNRKSP